MGLISEPLLFAIALVNTGSVLFLLVYFVSFFYPYLHTRTHTARYILLTCTDIPNDKCIIVIFKLSTRDFYTLYYFCNMANMSLGAAFDLYFCYLFNFFSLLKFFLLY